MWRRILLILLCMIIPWQSVKAAEGGLLHAAEMGNTMGHLHDHVMHEAHHHGGHDGDVVYDQTQDSTDHVNDHCACSTGWLLPLSLDVVATTPATQLLPDWVSRPLPAPVLDKPPRPPHHAG